MPVPTSGFAGSFAEQRHARRNERDGEAASRQRADQQGDADKAQRQPSDAQRRRTRATGAYPVEQRDVDGRHRHDERRQPRRNILLSPGHAAIAREQQEPTQDERCVPVHQLRSFCAAQEEPAEDQRPGDEEARARHQQRRHRLDRHADGEIGGAPDDIDGEEGGADLQRQA
jgi:hypothetical protein